MSGELGVVDWSEALSQVFMYRGRLVRFIRGGRHKVKGLPPGRVLLVPPETRTAKEGCDWLDRSAGRASGRAAPPPSRDERR